MLGGTMLIFRLSILTCTIYLVITLLVELGMMAFAHFYGGVIIGGRPWAIGLIFCFVWLLSYSIAWHILRVP